MTVGIVGYGAIGSRVVKLLKAFGCKLLVADPYVQLSAQDRNDGVEHVALDELLARADVVTPACPGDVGDDRLHRPRRAGADEAGCIFHQYGARPDGRL